MVFQAEETTDAKMKNDLSPWKEYPKSQTVCSKISKVDFPEAARAQIM